ncbi:TIR domain-containing protein [Psychrilyobacter atlanticus]|uniref:TIR domain-containing protein n=1 Tax=Psychrilyobacter atlanticus TaxID=271091 RepID=UPI0003F52A36|nr:TIR domain-containing protein [Psychrilyobacter atlanticus]
MARKTFISYKYNEAQELRDNIIEKLGEDARYYKGETSSSPDLTDKSTETIKEYLKDMIYDTSVLVVIISPNIKESSWIDWEIAYALKEIKRGDQTSKINGIVGIVQKVDGDYSWIANTGTKTDGCSYISYDNGKLYPIINKNMYNSEPPIYHCENCEIWCGDKGSYISFVKEDHFLEDPNMYIERAYEKINEKGNYDISKEK